MSGLWAAESNLARVEPMTAKSIPLQRSRSIKRTTRKLGEAAWQHPSASAVGSASFREFDLGWALHQRRGVMRHSCGRGLAAFVGCYSEATGVAVIVSDEELGL